MKTKKLKDLADSLGIQSYIDFSNNTLYLCLSDDEPDVPVRSDEDIFDQVLGGDV